jgi:hypothetical protein
MNRFQRALRMMALVAGAWALVACQSLNPGEIAAGAPAAKIDSGLGELPHYRDWVDPSGRMSMDRLVSASDSAQWP